MEMYGVEIKKCSEEYWDDCKENTTVEIGHFENGKITYPM